MAKRNEGQVTVNYLLWPWTTNKEGKHPVKLRVTHQRRREYYNLLTADRQKLFLTQQEFDHLSGTALSKLRNENRVIRETMDRAVDTIQDAIRNATANGKKPFSFGEFERKYLGAEANKNFLAYFKAHIGKLTRKGQAGTVRTFSSAYSALNTFQHGRDFDPADLTAQKLEAFDEWLRTATSTKKALTDTSISIYMRCLRVVYNEMAANDEHLATLYPFSRKDSDKKYKIPASRGQKGTTMTKDEMINFINGKVQGERIPENPMYRAKQLFLFSFFGQGVNFKDLALLRYKNVGSECIEFERQKTIRTKTDGRKIRIQLTERLTEILIEQGALDKRDENYIFGLFDASQIYTAKRMDDMIRQWIKTTNKWLKRYCDFNGLPDVSTYTARHTFASISKSHLSVAMISEMLGHSRLTTTQVYLSTHHNSENREALEKVFGSIDQQSA